MPAPLNYTALQTPVDLGASLGQGLQIGAGIQQVALQRQAMQDQIAQREMALQAQRQYQTDVADAISNPDPAKTLALRAKYPQFHEALTGIYKSQSEERQKQDITNATSAYAALSQNRPDEALGVYQRERDALANSGKPTDQVDQIINLIKTDPKKALGMASFALAHMVPPEQFKAITNAPYAGDTAAADASKAQADASKSAADATTAAYTAQNAPTAIQLGNKQKAAEIANLNSQIGNRAAQLGLDRQKFAADVNFKLAELNQKSGPNSPEAQKLVNDSTTNAVAAQAAAAQTLDLASRFEKSNALTGTAGTLAEALKSIGGVQDDVTALRQEYVRLRSTQVQRLLPPGPASDKDIALALKGFPSDTTDVKQIGSFLRGMAKLQTADAVANNAKAEWVGVNGNLGKAKQDVEVDGVKVPAGTSFADFAQSYLKAKTKDKFLELNAPSLLQQAKRAPDGKLYAPDPNRPGKYVMVQE